MSIEMLKDFFMWGTIINFSLLIISFIFCIGLRGLVYKIHSKIFKISEDAFNLVIYSFFGTFKILAFIFFLVPWVVLEIIG